MKKNKLGMGLGIVLLLYVYYLMARVIPDMSDFKMISTFYYTNADDVFQHRESFYTGDTDWNDSST